MKLSIPIKLLLVTLLMTLMAGCVVRPLWEDGDRGHHHGEYRHGHHWHHGGHWRDDDDRDGWDHDGGGGGGGY